MADGAPQTFTVDQVVAIYQKTKSDIDVLSAKHAAEMDPLNVRLNVCKSWLLDYLNRQGLENARTEHGLIYKSQVMSATVDPEGGWPALFGFILDEVLDRALAAVEQNLTEEQVMEAAMQSPRLALLNHAVNKTAVKELLEQEVVVPGVKVAHVTQLGVRKA
jgi:hypothetical protein